MVSENGYFITKGQIKLELFVVKMVNKEPASFLSYKEVRKQTK